MEGVTGIVLAGGRGSRLGGVNKALLDIGGRTTLERTLAALADVAEETILVVNDDSLAGTSGVRFVRDPEPHAGVLPALLAALETATRPLAALVACDMPFLDGALLRWLVDRSAEFDVVIPTVGDQLQPMHAVYRRDVCRAAIAAALARGDRRMISFLDAVRVRRVAEDELRRLDPNLRSFFNINTAEDLAEARGMAAAR
jgi:molybdenum cofactor guanylyltransferase